MGFEKQKTLPVKPLSAGLASRSIGLAVERQVRYSESRARSEDEIVCLGESSFTELGNREAEVDRPSGSQKLQRFKLGAGRLEAIPLTADGERNAVDLRAQEDLDEDIPLEDQADDYGFREVVPDPRDVMEETLDDAGRFVFFWIARSHRSLTVTTCPCLIMIQVSIKKIRVSKSISTSPLPISQCSMRQSTYRKAVLTSATLRDTSCAISSPRTSMVVKRATQSPPSPAHQTRTNASPRRRSHIPPLLVARWLIIIKCCKKYLPIDRLCQRKSSPVALSKRHAPRGTTKKITAGKDLQTVLMNSVSVPCVMFTFLTQRLTRSGLAASTWSTFPSRQTIKTKPKVPVKTAAKFSLPNGLFGKNRQPNPTLFSGPSHEPSRAKTYQHSAPTRLDPDQADPARKVTLFHPTPRPDISIGTASSPTPSPLVKPRPLHRSYTKKAALAKSSSDERPLTTPLTSVLLQPTYLDPLEPSRICVNLRDLARDYRSYRLAIGASHRVYTPPPLVSQTSQEHPAR